MILGIIILTASVLGLGYAMYKSNVESRDNRAQELQDDWYTPEQPANYPKKGVEGDIDNKLNQLKEYLHAYEQYYEQKTWENHNCKQLAEQCMALVENSEERLALYQVMKHQVTEFNRYMRVMESFSQNELNQGWKLALELRNMRLNNPEQAALLDKYWEELVPYVISENYFHPTLNSNLEYRTKLLQELKLNIITSKQEYAETHKQELQWEQEYNHIKSETIMANAELETARMDMEAADHALALMLAQSGDLPQQTLIDAQTLAADHALILKEAEVKAGEVDKIRMQLETARMDKEEDKVEQILKEHHQPGDELHPNLPQGARIVPGNHAPLPPAGGGWWSNFVEWIWSWIS